MNTHVFFSLQDLREHEIERRKINPYRTKKSDSIMPLTEPAN